jgi:hypothetical protein
MQRPGTARAGRQCQPLEALVVLAAAFRIGRLRRFRAGTGIVGGEVILAVAFGDERLRRPDRRQQPARRREAVDVGTIFVADEKPAIRQQHQRFGVDADAAVRRLRQVGQAVRRGADAVRVEPGERFSGRVGEQNATDERCRDALLALRGRHGLRVVERLEGDGKLVDARAVIDRSADVVAAVGQHVERALVARGRSRPRRRIDRDGGSGAEGLPELVAQIGGQASDPDQRLVDEDQVADGDGFGGARRGRDRKHREQSNQADDR